MAEPSVTLHSSGLLSKWGFGDGDTPDAWFDWLDEYGIDYHALPSWRDTILPALVRRYLLPKIEQDVKVIEISTLHNPIRASTVDGMDVEDCWYDLDGPALTPEFVTVPMADVLALARSLPR